MIRGTRLLSVFVVLAALALASGCLNKLPQYTPKMETVDMETDNWAGSASVDIESSGHSGVVGMVSRGAQIAAINEINEKFRENFDTREIEEVAHKAMVQAFEEDAPFEAGEDDTDGWMKVAIKRYGIEQAGSRPAFFVNYKTEIRYTGGDGEILLWRRSYHCQTSDYWDFGGHIVSSLAFLKAVSDMSDDEFESFVEKGFEECSHRVANWIERASQ